MVNPEAARRAEAIGPIIATDSGYEVFFRSDGEEALVVALDSKHNETTIVSVLGDPHHSATKVVVSGTWERIESDSR